MRYITTSEIKKNGVVYTPSSMAAYLAKEMVKYAETQLPDTTIRILDPAAGQGELLLALIEQLEKVYTRCQIEVVGYETDPSMCYEIETRIVAAAPECSVNIINEDFISAVFSDDILPFDFIIANPPYIRTQIMGHDYSQFLARTLNLSGRVDAYYAFLLLAKKVLKSTGVAGYITSNKFLTIKSGQSVRNYMLENYKVHHIVDLGDTKMFGASVLPCIIIFSNGTTESNNAVQFSSVYEEKPQKEILAQISSIFDGIGKTGAMRLHGGKTYSFQQGTIQNVGRDCLWTISSDETERWLQQVEKNTWLLFSDIGHIRVGIKTTADNVFIGDDWDDRGFDIELLRPLITHRNAGQIICGDKPMWKVLYTHTVVNGKRVAYDLEDYPCANAYLTSHYEQLSSRKYLQEAGRNWYEIWVPQNPAVWGKRKIVFRDISETPQFWLDNSGCIVNGDCYWIEISDDVSDDIVFLALAVANSKFIEQYYDVKFNTKLYSGKRRYMSQYVKQFPIPFPGLELSQKAIQLVKKIIAENGYGPDFCYKKELDSIVEAIFN